MNEHLSVEALEELLGKKQDSTADHPHLRDCSSCRALWNQMQQLHESKLMFDGEKMTRRVSHHLKRRHHRRRLQKVLAGAACALMAGGLWYSSVAMKKLEMGPVPIAKNTLSEPVERSIAWLKNAREEDGHWSAQRWGGVARFDVAVSALALMPLLEDTEHFSKDDATQSLEYLESQQREDGGFGPAFVGDMYNHCMATLALLKARKNGLDVSGESIERGITHLMTFQHSNGGWSYRTGIAPELALSLWVKDVLEELPQAADSDPKRRLDTWLKSTTDNVASETFQSKSSRVWMTQFAKHQSNVAEEASPMQNLSSYDIYQLYYLSRTLQSDDSRESTELKQNLKSHLLEHQVDRGELAGSWTADDTWGRVGGRLYNTGMALMCLMQNGRT